MKKSQRTVLALLFVLFLFLGILYVKTGRTPNIALPPSGPSPTAAPSVTQSVGPLVVPSLVPPNNPVVFRFSALPDFPSFVPLYGVLPNENYLQRASRAALSLGFSGEPTKERAGIYTFYSWKGANNTLFSAQEGAWSLSFSRPVVSGGGVPEPSEALARVEAAIRLSGAVDQSVGFINFSSSYYKSSGVNPLPATKKTADVVSVSAQYAIGDIPLCVDPLSPSSANAFLDSSGAIHLLSFSLLPSLATKENVSLVPVRQAADVLTRGGGSLVSVTSRGLSEMTPSASYTTVSISSVSLVYVLDKEQGVFVPFYQFVGVGSNKEEQQNVTYILSAVQ